MDSFSVVFSIIWALFSDKKKILVYIIIICLQERKE
jgi:hypothetical protein